MLNVTGVVRVVTEPEVRSAGNTPVVSFRAVNNEKRGGKEIATFLACSFFGDRATKVAQYIRKGEKLGVTGSLSAREYEHKGEKRTSLDLRINDVELLGTRPGTGGTTPSASDASTGYDDSASFNTDDF